jgi:peptide/nickel transport system ATP-binding protein
MTTPLLQVNHVTRTYVLPRKHLWDKPPVVHALQGVSFTIERGRSLGVVGESGSGKSTLARVVMALEPPTSGSVQMLGQDLNQLAATELRSARRDFQMVFQDPYGSLDPRQTIFTIITEPLAALSPTSTTADRRSQAADVLASVGLRGSDLDKYPHEFSGGQRQRVAIARALITRPKLIVADEPVSALDVSVQAQVLNLMQDLQRDFGVTYLLISHDLAVVNHLCDEVAVMFQGRVVEQGTPQTLFQNAAHPYTRALVDAVPRMQPAASPEQRKRAPTVTPRQHPATACPYAHRCPNAQPQCDEARPELREVSDGHFVACHLA